MPFPSVPTVPFPLTEVRPYGGAPALFIEGEPVFPLILMTGVGALAKLNAIQPTGIQLLTDSFDTGWNGIDRYEFEAFDNLIAQYLTLQPEAMFLPRVQFDAPADWMDAHPDELIGYADPQAWDGETCWGGPRHASFASRPWRDAAGEALRRLIRHVSQQDYAARIWGWHIGSGVYGEWHAWNAVYYPDTSKPFVEAFGTWLRERYPGQNVEPRLPSLQDHLTGDCGVFRDPAKWGWMNDHSRFFHLLGFEVLSEFAAIAKHETQNRSIVLAFNGYLPELGVNQEIDHNAFDRTIRNSNVDAFSSPHSYARRKLGESGLIRGYLGSMRSQGKLWIDEADERTHITGPSPWTHVEILDDALQVLWRSFAHALTNNCGLWFMDQGGLWFESETGSWYAEPAILEAFVQMKRIGEESMQRPRTRSAEVAAVLNLESAFQFADREPGLNDASVFTIAQTEALARCGAPFDLYLLSELFEPNVPDYKVYVFLDPYLLNDADLERVMALKNAGKTLIFCYAAGLLSETELSLERMEKLLGMSIQIVDSVTLANGAQQAPGFVVEGLRDGVAQNGNVFYCPAPPIKASQLREILRAAGVHIFLESDDNLMEGGGYIGIHAATAGVKSLRLSHPARWDDPITGQSLAADSPEFSFEMRQGETRLLSFDAVA